MSKLNEQIKEMSFPKSGNYFAVASKRQLMVDVRTEDCVIVKEKIPDRSYCGKVLQCLESDATRVVCRTVDDWGYGKSMILIREDWRFDNIDHLLPSLGFAVPEYHA